MVNTKLNLSMTEPYVRQIYAKEGDTGRVLEIGLEDYPTENGTLRILRPDGVEVTADAIKSAGGDAYKGDLVTFDALEEVPLTKCEVSLESSQDLHGQSNPYPAGGGKNLVGLNTSPNGDITYTNVTASEHTNEKVVLTSSGANTYCQMQLKYALKAGTYTASVKTASTDSFAPTVSFYHSNNSLIVSGVNATTSKTFTLNADEVVSIRFFATSSDSTLRTVTFYDFQLEQGSTATSYAPYSNICPISGHTEVNVYVEPTYDESADPTATVALGQTVYGGTLDVVGGKLTIDRYFFEATNSIVCSLSSQTSDVAVFDASFQSNSFPNHSTTPQAISNRFSTAIASGVAGRMVVSGQHLYFVIAKSELSSVDQAGARTWLTNNPSQFCYKLATPIEVDLTPTQISTLLGENNIWSSGEVEVAFEYDGLFAQLPQQATAVVGRCIGDVNFNGASTMPFTLVVKPNNKENT